MNRRKFLAGVGATGIGLLAGCAGVLYEQEYVDEKIKIHKVDTTWDGDCELTVMPTIVNQRNVPFAPKVQFRIHGKNGNVLVQQTFRTETLSPDESENLEFDIEGACFDSEDMNKYTFEVLN